MVTRAYLDWNATAPLRPEAQAAIVAALAQTMGAKADHGALSAVAAAIFATSAALSLHREAKLGIRTGHAEVKAVINAFIAAQDQSNPARKPAKPRAKRTLARQAAEP